MKKITFLLFAAFMAFGYNVWGQVFITELADPNNSSGARFVEIYNAGATSIDLSTGWQLQRATNGNTYWQTAVDLTGTISAGGFYLVCANQTTFTSTYGFAADQDIGTGGSADSNGDDQIRLLSPVDVVEDMFGLLGEDGSGTDHEFEDGRAERKATVTTGNTTYTFSEWNIWNDTGGSGTTNLPQNAPDDFDPGAWIGTGGSSAVASPVFDPTAGIYYSPQNVSITTTTLGAIIYYTTDGNDPDITSAVYTTPISISITTTLKAFAVDPSAVLDDSPITSGLYRFPIEIADLATLRSQVVGSDVYELTGEAILTFQQSYRNNKYIQDATAAILIDDDSGIITTAYDIYDGITGLTGTLSEYGGMLQFIPTLDPGVATSTGNTITPQVVTLAQINSSFDDYESELVKVESVVFTDAGLNFANGTVYEITDGSKISYNFRTTFYDVDYIGTEIPSGSLDLIIIPNSRTDGEYVTSRLSSDISSNAIAPHIAGNMQGWDPDDPDYAMTLNANSLYELTKTLGAGSYEYKLVADGNWYPGNNQSFTFTATENVTWKANTANLVTHTLPLISGSFLSELGGTDWDATDLTGEMTDPDGDDIFTVELTIPAGNYEGKVTLNHNWEQSTGGNVPFTTDGVNPTTFTYDFPNNTTSISGPPPPTATITFIVDDAFNMNYDGFFLKGSWDVNGQYDPSWGGGAEHSAFYDDGTHGDVTAGDHIWTCQQDLVVDGGSNTWEWGVNDTENNWIAGNWQFTITDQTPQTLSWIVPDVVDLVINEIMYNSTSYDEEWIELYNNTTQTIDLENYNICDNDASHTHIIIPAGYSVAAGGYFTISIATNGAFPFTPDYDGTGNFSLNNGGDDVRVWNDAFILVDIVSYDDSSPWPTEPDGDGPSLSLLEPDLDNSLAESWDASREDGGTPGAENFPPLPYVTITDPNGGEFITQGEAYDITWIFDFWTGDIDIKLVKEGYSPVVVGSDIAVADGVWTWNVSSAIQLGDDYKIMIVPVNSGDPADESDDYFSIIEPYVAPIIVITEIMYNPPESNTDSLEFLELYNNGDETVNLEGFHFTEGIEFVFPSIDLAPEGYLLVAVNSSAMMNTFGVDALQWTGGGLSNGGEDIELQDSFDFVIDSLTYDDYLPWDTLADGKGPSLTLCNPDVDNSIAENWTHSINLAAINADGDSIWATPGFGCVAELLPGFEADVTSIEVGESVLFTDLTIGDPTEWIWTFEGGTPNTYNGQTPPDIYYNDEGTWDVTLYVSDGANSAEVTYSDYIEVVYIPDPFVTITNPNGGEFISQGEAYGITWIFDFWTGDIDIKLVKEGDTPVLLGSNISVEDVSWTWDVSPTQQLGDDFKIMIVPVDPDDPSDESDDYFSIIEPYIVPEIVITEIMYNPPESGTDSLEFLELYNNGVEIVNLEGFYFAEGIEYIFPNIDLAPDNYLLVSVNSLAMMNTFGVDAMQWTGGGLSNSGEDIELRDSFDNVVDSLTYDDVLPWDPLADGNGPSLTLCNPNVDNSIPENWTHSVHFAALNAAGDSIWATPGFGCQVDLLPGFDADATSIIVGDYVMFTDLTIGDPIDWKWTFEGGTPEIVFGQTPPEIYYNEVGIWDVTLFVSDGTTNAEVTYENYIEVIELPAPTYLVAEVGPYDDVLLTWTAPITLKLPNGVAAELLGYNVYRDGDQINDVIVDETEYYDALPPIGSHVYYVTALYDSGESAPSNLVTIVVTNINEVEVNLVNIYPNPAEDMFTVEYTGENALDISIIDITGHVVYYNTVNKTSQTNISGLHRGMYFVRLYENFSNKLVIKKLIVK